MRPSVFSQVDYLFAMPPSAILGSNYTGTWISSTAFVITLLEPPIK